MIRSAPSDHVSAWAASGAMALTGWPDRPPLGPPAPLVDGVRDLGDRIAARSGVELDWLALLGERAAIQGLTRHGQISCGEHTQLLQSTDGWIAVTLARPDDVELVPAWLRGGDIAALPAAALVEQAALLGLPVSALGEWKGPAIVRTDFGPCRPGPSLDSLVVADLSALWAGPLCASIFALAGADVVKVESTSRPDAPRIHAEFFELLNGRKRERTVEFTANAMAEVINEADVVIESSRPRALEQVGLRADDFLTAPAGPRLWISVTGYGRSSTRVAFGDDAAVAGGLVVDDGSGPCFCADAIADPLTGLAAAAAALDALATGGRWLVDVAMAGVSASFAGPTLPALDVAPASPHPSPRP